MSLIPASRCSRRLFLRSSLALALLPLGTTLASAQEDFSSWVQGLRRDALAEGIHAATFDRAMAGVAPIPRIIELDHKQPETTLTFDEYVTRVASAQRRKDARSHYQENHALLDEVGKRYGVSPHFIVALWGVETDFGRLTGTFSVVSALATLAYDGRRAAFFRRELLNALKILDRTHMDPHRMLGSWAGAMGQSQFMPSSFLAYAVSYRGGAAPDIWTSREDVFASIANYLSRSGWHAEEGWGRQVMLPPGFDASLVGITTRRPMPGWSAVGVKRVDGGALPSFAGEASLIQPGGPSGPAFLVYDNFRTLLKWNNSTYFATAVGYLADSLNPS